MSQLLSQPARMPDSSSTGEKVGIGVDPRASALACLLLSGLATFTANTPGHEGHASVFPGKPIGVEVGLHHVAEPETFGPAISSKVGGLVLSLPGIGFQPKWDKKSAGDSSVPVTVEYVTGTEQFTAPTTLPAMLWAEKFSKDPNAKKMTDGGAAINSLAGSIELLEKQGWNILDITAHGYASDEDDTAWNNGGDNPGLGIPNKKNVELAETRAATGATMLKDELTSIGSSAASKVRVTGGTEIIDNELNAAIFGIAKGNGLSAQDLVVGFNRKDPDVLKLLSKGDTDTLEGLVNDRYVLVMVKAEKPIVQKRIVSEETPTEMTEGSEDSFKVVFIPMLIPILRRRKPGNEPVVPFPTVVSKPRPVAPTTGPEQTRGSNTKRLVDQHNRGPAYKHKQPAKINGARGGASTRGHGDKNMRFKGNAPLRAKRR